MSDLRTPRGLDVDGTAGVLATLVSVLDEPDPDFTIVTP
ncbi:alkyl sulfatase C-terminal domain-containing protein [Rhodococcus sp. 5G237]